MKYSIRQFLRDLALAFAVVVAFLALQGELDRRQTIKHVADAYKRGVSVGIMAGRAHHMTPAVQSQLVEICGKDWPETVDGAEARRRACGVTSQIARADQ
jgi:uncharacterized protein YebE (UPF0316 family)